MTTTALTVTQKANARAEKRWRRYFLAVSNPPTVYTARINQSFTSLDNVIQLTYDTGSGTLAAIMPGMSCYIGSSAGASDIGVVRVRKTPTSTVLFIGKVSGMQFADNLYLTIVQDFALWARDSSAPGGVTVLDEDVLFDQVQSFAPIVKAGPLACILEMTSATIGHSPIISAVSPAGRAIASYQHYAPGASASSNMTTATPTITYNAAGEYYERFTATDISGGVGTCYRKVFVNPTEIEISPPEPPSGDVDSGGWSFAVEGYSGVTQTTVKDRALCVLWSKDYVETARVASQGNYSDNLNVRCVGWLDKESLGINPVYGTASFRVDGPAALLDRISGAPFTVTDSTGPSVSWDIFGNLTTDLALYRLVAWQSTLSSITDITLTGDTTRIPFAAVNSESLRSQINSLASEKLLARIIFDRFGCGFVFKPVSLMNSTERAAVPVLYDFLAADWENIDIPERVTVPQTAQIELSGSTWDGAVETQLYSRAPGSTSGAYGQPTAPYSTLALSSQADLNRRAGDLLASDNNEYPALGIDLYYINDYLDIAPAQIVRCSLASTDTPRGITWTNKHMIPLAITYHQDDEGQGENSEINFEAETSGVTGITYYPPSDYTPPPQFPIIPPIHFPPIVPPPHTWFPPFVPVGPPAGVCADSANGPFSLAWTKSKIFGTDSDLTSRAYFPCKIRPSSFSNKTRISISIRWAENVSAAAIADAKSAFHCYAIDAGGNRLLTGSVTPGDNEFFQTIVSFAPISAIDVAGFEITLDAGEGPGPFTYIAGDVISSGSVNASNSTGTLLSGMTTGQLYCTDDTGGPWYGGGLAQFIAYEGKPNGVTIKSSYKLDYFLQPGTGNNAGHGRNVFSAPGTDVHFTVSAPSPSSTGALGFYLRKCTVTGLRSIALGSGILLNVCAVG